MRKQTVDSGTRYESSNAAARSGRGKRGRDDRDRRRLLSGGTPREVLARLLEGDPLELRTVVAGRLRAGRLLLDADRVYLCSLARCAREARRYTGRPGLHAWLIERVDDAVNDVLRRELARVRAESDGEGGDARAGVPEERDGAHVELALPLGLDPLQMRAACTRFNALAPAERDAFFALFVEGRSLDELALAAGLSVSAVARRARLALDALLRVGGRR